MSSCSSTDDEMLTFSVIRTSDAKKTELTLPLSTKLGDLKSTLSEEQNFGPAPVENQRIFHLGREWKSQGRSLAKLGLGRFNNCILHLQIRPDKKGSQRTRSQKRVMPVAEVKNSGVIELLDDSDDEVQATGSKRPRVS